VRRVISPRLRYLGWLMLPCSCPNHRMSLGTWPGTMIRLRLAYVILGLTDTPLPRVYLLSGVSVSGLSSLRPGRSPLSAGTPGSRPSL